MFLSEFTYGNRKNPEIYKKILPFVSFFFFPPLFLKTKAFLHSVLSWPSRHPLWIRSSSMAFIFYASPSIASLSPKVSMHIHETWEPSCGQNHSYSSGCYPKTDVGNPGLNFALGLVLEKGFNQLNKNKCKSFSGSVGRWPHYTSLLLAIIWCSAHIFSKVRVLPNSLPLTLSFFPPYSLLLFSVLCRLFFCSDSARFSQLC